MEFNACCISIEKFKFTTMKTKRVLSTWSSRILITILIGFFSAASFGQSNGEIRGTVIDEESGKPIPFATVYVSIGDRMVGTQTDDDGSFVLKPLPSGEYIVNFKFTGYTEKAITNVYVYSDRITFLNNTTMLAGIGLKTVVIYAKLIDPEATSINQMTALQMQNIPEKRDLFGLLSVMSSDIQVSEERDEIYFRGSRDKEAIYIIDGMKMINPSAMCPGMAIGSLSVYTGGVPAKYGDFTGGVIVIETMSYFDWLNIQRAKEMNDN